MGGPPRLPWTEFCPPLPPLLPQAGRPAFLAPGEKGGADFSQCLLSVHSTIKEELERTPDEYGDPEATGCFKQVTLVSSVPEGEGHLLRVRRIL